MKFDTSLPPEEFFFVPGRDPGLSWLEAPGWIMRRIPAARVRLIAASDLPEIQTLIEKRFDPRWQHPAMNVTFEFNTVPVVLEDASHRGAFVSTGGKWIMNAASGDRLIEKYLLDSDRKRLMERRIHRLFADAREAGPTPIPFWEGAINDDVVIECRNQYNFYHFVTEALCKLEHFARMPHQPRITFQCRKGPVRAFPMRFVEALYPEVADRVAFVDTQIESERVLAPYNFRHYYYQAADPLSDAQIVEAAAQDEWWGRLGTHRARRKFVLRNSVDTDLLKLRERALARVDPQVTAGLPRRIIVSRDPAHGARARALEGSDAMVRALKPHGFVEVYFERMSPLEQIASVQAADIIIAEHGAALAHMMFARPDAHVIEIGTAQTQFYRWGDFLGNAHASGCTYTTVFADIAGDTPEVVTPIVELHKGVRIGKRALDTLVELAERAG